MEEIKQKEAVAIIDSLKAGVVPSIGVQKIVVGRKLEVDAITSDIESVAKGSNVMKIWIGDFGSGKSFMFHLMNVLALKQRFVVASADFTPDIRLYSNDGKAVALYRQLMSNLMIQTMPGGGALPTLIEKWITQTMSSVASENKMTVAELNSRENRYLMDQAISAVFSEITDSGSYDLYSVVMRYYEAYVNQDDLLRRCALKWLQGEYTTKTEARADLGVREIVNDQNFYDIIKCLSRLFTMIGYSGLMINLDEAINLYKISTSTMREKNYEKILSIYNDCYQGRQCNLFVNIAGTKEFLINERRGLYSYEALRTRLQPNKHAIGEVKDFRQPVITIEPIGNEEILILLKNLRDIFNQRHSSSVSLSDGQIMAFMEDMYNKPGADKFLLPREVIREFLNIMDVMRQNPDVLFENMVKMVEVNDTRPLDEILDSIEEL